MAYDDMTRCPQTEEEFEAYFYALIGRTYGAPADGWEGVMEAAYPWQGGSQEIPAGVGPGIKAAAHWPFFGLTQQYSGGPKGRIFLPSETPDENGYYTRAIQYLDDAAGTYAKSQKAVDPKSSGLVWSWYWIAGHAYAPVTGADSTAPPDSSELAARVTALEEVSAAMGEEMDDLVGRVTRIESILAGGLHAHGPINLPIVLESLTSLRCKGDIDVQVKPGQAVPPPDTSKGPSSPLDLVILKRILTRDDEARS